MTGNNSPLERLLNWCAVEVESIRISNTIPSTGEIDDVATLQEIEQVEADMRAVERDHRNLVDAYGAAIQELQRRGAKSVPLTPSTARLRDLLGGYECPKCGGSGRIPVIDFGVGEVIDKVPCPVCRPDDTQRRDALEAAVKAAHFQYFMNKAPFEEAVKTALRTADVLLPAEPAVPEAVRRLPKRWVRRADDWALSYSDEMRGQLRTDAHELQHEIDQALAQHSEPEENDDDV